MCEVIKLMERKRLRWPDETTGAAVLRRGHSSVDSTFERLDIVAARVLRDLKGKGL